MSRFYFDGSDSGSDDEKSLPYPKPLAREAFLSQEFSPTEFLSSLRNRHQTLEDLRQELRTRSQELNKELLDLVNENYQDFLGLGDTLKGGEEKVEEVRLGLLGFRREVDSLKGKVEIRRQEIERLLRERRKITKDERVGKSLLEADAKLLELEEGLGLRANRYAAADGSLNFDCSESEEESDADQASHTVLISRLSRRVHQYLYLRKLISKIGPNHPFLSRQEGRVTKVRQTLLLDLNNALAQVRSLEGSGGQILRLLSLYREMGEAREALNMVRKSNQQ